MEPENAQVPVGPHLLPRRPHVDVSPTSLSTCSHCATYLSFTWSWFIQQESIWIGLESIISLGRTKGIPQIFGAGLGVGRRGGGNATAHAPVPTRGAAAAVGHIAALLPRVAGLAGSWRREDRGRSQACPKQGFRHGPVYTRFRADRPGQGPGNSSLESVFLNPIPGSGSAWLCHSRRTKNPKPPLYELYE